MVFEAEGTAVPLDSPSKLFVTVGRGWGWDWVGLVGLGVVYT